MSVTPRRDVPEPLSSVVESLAAIGQNSSPAAVLTGAGVSVESGVPLAGAIVEELSNRYQFGEGDLPGYSEAMSRAFGPDRRARRAFLNEKCVFQVPGPANRLIANLACRGLLGPLLTTNFDHLLEHALFGTCEGPVHVRVLGAGGSIRNAPKATTLFKLHGDVLYDLTAHEPDDIALHHEALAGELERSFRPETHLLVLGFSGWDEAVRSTILRLMRKGRVQRVTWSIFGGGPIPAHLQAWRESATALGALVRFVAVESLVELLGVIDSRPVDTDRHPLTLLPRPCIGSGVWSAAGEPPDLDGPAVLRGQQAVTSMGLPIPGQRQWLLCGESRHELVSYLVNEDPTSLVFAYGDLDGRNLPLSLHLLRSFSQFAESVTGRVLHPDRLEEALDALATLSVRIVLELSTDHGFSAVRALFLDPLLERLPLRWSLYVVAGFRPSPDLPSMVLRGSLGPVLELTTPEPLRFLRRTYRRNELVDLLRRTGDGRTVDQLLRQGLLEERGPAYAVRRRERLRDDTAVAARVAAALAETVGYHNAFEHIDRLAEVEYTAMLAHQPSLAIRTLIVLAGYWDNPMGAAFLNSTLADFDADLVAELDLSRVEWMQLWDIVTRHERRERLPYSKWSGAFIGTEYMPSDLRREAERQRSSVESELARGVGASLVSSIVEREQEEPGLGWELLIMALEQERDEQGGVSAQALREVLVPATNRLLDLEIGLTGRAAIFLDDLARALFLRDDEESENQAIALVNRISHTFLVDADPVQKVRHLVQRASMALLMGDVDQASSSVFEAMVATNLAGDQARHWATVMQFFLISVRYHVPTDVEHALRAWAHRWLAHRYRQEEAHFAEMDASQIVLKLNEACTDLGLSFLRTTGDGRTAGNPPARPIMFIPYAARAPGRMPSWRWLQP